MLQMYRNTAYRTTALGLHTFFCATASLAKVEKLPNLGKYGAKKGKILPKFLSKFTLNKDSIICKKN